MKMFEVVEYNTSKHRASHGVEVQRKPRGAVHCPGTLTAQRPERCPECPQEIHQCGGFNNKEARLLHG